MLPSAVRHKPRLQIKQDQSWTANVLCQSYTRKEASAETNLSLRRQISLISLPTQVQQPTHEQGSEGHSLI